MTDGQFIPLAQLPAQYGGPKWLLTCVAGSTFAGVAWGGRRLAYTYACGSVLAALWINQAGILHMLANLSCPPGRAETLTEQKDENEK